MSVAAGKRRYSMALNVTTVDRFHAICEKLKLPPSTMSQATDDLLRDLAGVLEKAHAKGNLTITDLFTEMGRQMELLQDEERGTANVRQERQKKEITRKAA
jgi:phosphoribosylformylglycinamidine (FGAM) synthase-like enzyme